MKLKRVIPLLGIFLFLATCQPPETRFRLVPPTDSGIDFVNTLTPTVELNILTYLYYYNGGGVAVADFTGDGLDDIYFTGNQCPDRFYLNKGGLEFEDVTSKSGISNISGWTTGVTHADINGDGLLDIYVCKVGDYKAMQGSNLLWMNEGVDENGIPHFVERATVFGLDIQAFSTQSTFFDYDLDGDLDMFLLCHSVHPNRSYGYGSNRMKPDAHSGDKLFENQDGHFTEVSQFAGIFQGKIGYGLGIAVTDLNLDGFPDLYIGNDFFENDYLYLNNGDKTFTEVISTDFRQLGHTTHYSMGNTASDINNDGLTDLVSLDMLPEDIVTLKSSGAEDPFPTYNRYLKNGYAPQYMQNTLHINKGDMIFSEVAYLAGIAATEWSWGVLAADFDLDGLKDLYITNGIAGATNDMDYINFIAQDDAQKEIGKENSEKVLAFTKRIPEKKVANYAFKNLGYVRFQDVSKDWFPEKFSFSTGSAYSDLDRDGDLDLVVNNVNQEAFIFENTSAGPETNTLQIQLNGRAPNRFGIGARIEVHAADLHIYEEHFPVRGYLSSGSNSILIGLGTNSKIDSLKVTWSDRTTQVLYGVSANRVLELNQTDARRGLNPLKTASDGGLSNVSSMISFTHAESTTVDFDRDPLLPFALSNEGPGIAVGDVNGDSLDDVFICGAKLQPSRLFLQGKNGAFAESQSQVFDVHAQSEDVDARFFDADGDNDLDLIVVSGGNEFADGEPLVPRLYRNESGVLNFQVGALPQIPVNASKVKSFDKEGDGDLDLIICSNAVPRRFGETPSNYILENNAGLFTDVSATFGEKFRSIGNVNDLTVQDLNGDGLEDLIVVGYWMPVTLLFTKESGFEKRVIPDSEGWWKSVAVADFDQDGDMDFVAGNWGLNTRLKASKDAPVSLYRSDFDSNGNTETVITYHYQGKEVLLASKDELVKQLPFINKTFLSYSDFAQADLEDIFPSDMLSKSMKKIARTLSTTYFENQGKNEFVIKQLPFGAQISSVNAILVDDFNMDQFDDILLVGNNYELSTQLGRLDASHGVLLINDKNGFFYESVERSFDVAGPARDAQKLVIEDTVHYMISINNDSPIFLKKTNE